MSELSGIIADIEVGGQSYRVIRARSVEPVSEVASLTCEILDDAELPNPDDVLDAKVVFTVARLGEGGDPKLFRGSVVAATRKTDREGRPSVSLTVAPALWKLSKRTYLRVFQDQTVVEVVKEVLKGAGITDVDERLSVSYEKRIYVTQYRESDLEFVMRLLSEEGIYFFYEFSEKELLVLCDDPKGAGDAADAELAYRPGLGFDVIEKAVLDVKQTRRVRTDKVMMREYDFERPRLKLESKAEGTDKGEHALEVYAYPGRFYDENVGKRFAQVLLDSMQADRDVAEGTATSLTLGPALRFSITDHPYAPLNAEYFLTKVVTEYRELGSSTDFAPSGFSCNVFWNGIPTKTSPYRPERRPRQATVHSLQTALTTGASGQEIHTDKHGRVKVRFPWDRHGKNDDTSSMWMRTSQIPTGGSMLLPRVGWEVLVQSNEGDADHPLVMGRLYNAEKPPPYALPANKARGSVQTATSPGDGSSNEIRTDDSKGGEEMFFNASKDMKVDVLNSTTETIANNSTHEVGGNHSLAVTNSHEILVGGNQSTHVGGNQNLKTSTFWVDDAAGSHKLTVGGNRDLKVGGDHKRTVDVDSSVSTGGMMTDLVVGSIEEKAGGNYTLDVSAVRAELTIGNHDQTIGGNHTETDGLAKVIVTFGGKSVDVTGSMTQMIGGAILAKVDGDRSENAGAAFTEVAAGANLIKADNCTFEAENALTVVMGASILSLTPVTVTLLGTNIKLDGDVAEESILILDN